jgi:hypothetical protein
LFFRVLFVRHTQLLPAHLGFLQSICKCEVSIDTHTHDKQIYTKLRGYKSNPLMKKIIHPTQALMHRVLLRLKDKEHPHLTSVLARQMFLVLTPAQASDQPLGPSPMRPADHAKHGPRPAPENDRHCGQGL